uniref:Allantoicase domain-containing protein n=1 Tax=Candidozyma auris TaxID=498019 RepID=A0A0L0NNU2_CANAR
MPEIYTEEKFNKEIVTNYVDVIGQKLGGQVLSFLDEFFAPAANLIKSTPVVFDPTKFVHSGKWFDGWETRRHNTEEADWVIFKAGVSSARIIGCEVDTAHFTGNAAPFISVEGVRADDDSKVGPDSKWEDIISKVECHPCLKHYFVRPCGLTKENYTHFRLRMYPDGGIARFRIYGKVVPILPKDPKTVIDLALVKNGGVAVKVSDQCFSSADNLLLPGRGEHMGDGWETKRSRGAGHVDWAMIKLGAVTKVQEVLVDTAHFRGNFPQKVNVKGYKAPEGIEASPDSLPPFDSDKWEVIVKDSKTGPHEEFKFKAEKEGPYSHVMLTMIPDGGVKRLRVFGTVAN